MSVLDTQNLCGDKNHRGYNQCTSSGKPFWACDPRHEDIRILDIAAHLSRMTRFGGALRFGIEIYSVAQHSVLVSQNVPAEYALEGLLHDAAEAYTFDAVKPIKHALPDFVALQDNIERVIRDKYGLPPEKSQAIRDADYRAVLTERRDVLPANLTVDWGVAKAEPWPEIIKPWLPSDAYFRFLRRFVDLTGGNEKWAE